MGTGTLQAKSSTARPVRVAFYVPHDLLQRLDALRRRESTDPLNPVTRTSVFLRAVAEFLDRQPARGGR